MSKIILASSSPRRKELMNLITSDFIVDASNIDETTPNSMKTNEIPEYLAIIKALETSKKYPDDIVIGADTSVIIDDKILGKPKDKDDAFQMIKKLSGKTHLVITGCAIVHKGKVESFSSITEVEFYNLTDEQITSYISTDEPYDKAGGYAIQQKGSLFVKSIKGDFYNVVGFPIARLNRRLKKLK